MSVFMTDGIMSYNGHTYRQDGREKRWRPIESRKKIDNDIEVVSVKTYNDKAVVVEYKEDGQNKRVRAVCQSEDTFDLEKGLMVCYLKMMHGNKWQEDIKMLNKMLNNDEETESKKPQKHDDGFETIQDLLKCFEQFRKLYDDPRKD